MDNVYKNFLETSYGSLKKAKYLLHFSLVENYVSKKNYGRAMELTEDVGADGIGHSKKVISYKFQVICSKIQNILSLPSFYG